MAQPETHKSNPLLIYGGGFDPPHRGHLHCLVTAMKSHPSAKCLLMPIPNNTKSKSSVASFYHRRNMTKLIAPKSSHVSSLEQWHGFTETKDTISYLVTRFKNRPLLFLLGDDQFLHIDSWRGFSYIMRNTKLLVIPRISSTKAVLAKKSFFEKTSNKIIPIEVLTANKMTAHSSDIRSLLAHGKKSPLLTAAVAAYISSHSLYC